MDSNQYSDLGSIHLPSKSLSLKFKMFTHHSVGNGVRRWRVTNLDEGGVLEFPKVKTGSSSQFVENP